MSDIGRMSWIQISQLECCWLYLLRISLKIYHLFIAFFFLNKIIILKIKIIILLSMIAFVLIINAYTFVTCYTFCFRKILSGPILCLWPNRLALRTCAVYYQFYSHPSMFSYISLSPINRHHVLRGFNISCSNIEYLTHKIQRLFFFFSHQWFFDSQDLSSFWSCFAYSHPVQIGFLGQIWYMILWWDLFAILHWLGYWKSL